MVEQEQTQLRETHHMAERGQVPKTPKLMGKTGSQQKFLIFICGRGVYGITPSSNHRSPIDRLR